MKNIMTLGREEVQPAIEKLDIMEDIFDVSNSIDGVLEIPQPDSKDLDASPINQDTNTSEVHPPMEATSSEINFLSSVQNQGPCRVSIRPRYFLVLAYLHGSMHRHPSA